MQNRLSIKQETEKCAGHHFARVTLDCSRRVVDEVHHNVTYYEEEIVGEGVTKRSGKDRNDDYVGENLALGRALEHLTAKVMRRANGKVKHNDDMKQQRAERKAKREQGDHIVFFGLDLDTVKSINEANERLIDEC